MARHTNQAAAERLSDALTRLREERNNPSFKDIERWMWRRLGSEHAPSDETIRRLHLGADPYGTAPEILLALAMFYGVEPEDLGPEVAERVGALRLLLAALDNAAEVTHRYLAGATPLPEELTGGDVQGGRDVAA